MKFAARFAVILFESFTYTLKGGGLWKWTPYNLMIDVKFDGKVVKKLEIGLFLPISNKQSANFHTGPGWKLAEWFALILLESFPYTLKGGPLKMNTIWFENRRQIWRQSRKKLEIGLFSLISKNQSANFHTGPGWKLAEWFVLILFHIPWKMGPLKMNTIRFENRRQIWRQSRKKLEIGLFSPISKKQGKNFHTRPAWIFAD